MLTSRFVNTVKTKKDYLDGGGVDGLYLQVGDGGRSKSWVLRYTGFDGKERNMGLGSARIVGPAEARTRAREARLKLLDGIDPIDARRKKKQEQLLAAGRSVTFEQCFREYMDNQKVERIVHGEERPGLMPSSWRAVNNRIRRHLLPLLGKLPVGAIGITEIHNTLMKIHEGSSPTTARARLDLELILDWAKAKGYRTGDNPAELLKGGPLLTLMPWLEGSSAYHTGKHFTGPPYDRMAEFMKELRAVRRAQRGIRGVTQHPETKRWQARVTDPRNGRRYHLGFFDDAESATAAAKEAACKMQRQIPGEQRVIAALALELIILTGVREGQIAGARWDEFDLEKERVWVCPWQRTKKHQPPDHIVPLSPAAIALLKMVKAIQKADGYTGPYVFVQGTSEVSTGGTAYREAGQMLSGLAPIHWLRSWPEAKRFKVKGKTITVHGFRKTFKTWSRKRGWPEHLSEAALDHLFGSKMSRTYIDEEENRNLAEERRPMLEAWADECSGQPTPSVARRAS
jgi:integrase